MPPVKEYKIESISETPPTNLDIKQTAELKQVRYDSASQSHGRASHGLVACSFSSSRACMRVLQSLL